MNDKMKKEGVTVKEIEGYAKNYKYEIFFCVLFFFATLFSLVFWGATLSIFFAGIGAIVGALLAEKIHPLQHKIAAMIRSKEPAFQLILGLLGLIVAIFLAPVIFVILGMNGGKSMIRCLKGTDQG